MGDVFNINFSIDSRSTILKNLKQAGFDTKHLLNPNDFVFEPHTTQERLKSKTIKTQSVITQKTRTPSSITSLQASSQQSKQPSQEPSVDINPQPTEVPSVQSANSTKSFRLPWKNRLRTRRK